MLEERINEQLASTMAAGDAGYTARLVVNSRCNFKCFFCYQEGTSITKNDAARPEFFFDAVSALARLRPLSKVRITGGEPLLYPHLYDLFRMLYSQFPSVSLGLTTNGSRVGELVSLAQSFPSLHINISLPTLRKDRFKSVTASKHLDSVMSAITALASRDLTINHVCMPTVNGDETADILSFSRTVGARLKLICLTSNVHNQDRLLAVNTASTDQTALAQHLGEQGYRLYASDRWKREDHEVAIVDCFNQEPVAYFKRYKTLRIYFSGLVAINGDYDGFARYGDLETPGAAIADLLDDIEAALDGEGSYA